MTKINPVDAIRQTLNDRWIEECRGKTELIFFDGDVNHTKDSDKILTKVTFTGLEHFHLCFFRPMPVGLEDEAKDQNPNKISGNKLWQTLPFLSPKELPMSVDLVLFLSHKDKPDILLILLIELKSKDTKKASKQAHNSKALVEFILKNCFFRDKFDGIHHNIGKIIFAETVLKLSTKIGQETFTGYDGANYAESKAPSTLFKDKRLVHFEAAKTSDSYAFDQGYDFDIQFPIESHYLKFNSSFLIQNESEFSLHRLWQQSFPTAR